MDKTTSGLLTVLPQLMDTLTRPSPLPTKLTDSDDSSGDVNSGRSPSDRYGYHKGHNNQHGLWSKAFALRYLTHLIGDLHQPMHCVSLISQLFPQGDQGGNLFPLTAYSVPRVSIHSSISSSPSIATQSSASASISTSTGSEIAKAKAEAITQLSELQVELQHSMNQYESEQKEKGNGRKKYTELHAFFDSAAGLYDRKTPFPITAHPLFTAHLTQQATELTQRFPLSNYPFLPSEPLNYTAWCLESRAVAIDLAYTKLTPGEPLSTPTAAHDAYMQMVQHALAERLALGGYRLARLLNVVVDALSGF
jgi:hypothetical protein